MDLTPPPAWRKSGSHRTWHNATPPPVTEPPTSVAELPPWRQVQLQQAQQAAAAQAAQQAAVQQQMALQQQQMQMWQQQQHALAQQQPIDVQMRMAMQQQWVAQQMALQHQLQAQATPSQLPAGPQVVVLPHVPVPVGPVPQQAYRNRQQCDCMLWLPYRTAVRTLVVTLAVCAIVSLLLQVSYQQDTERVMQDQQGMRSLTAVVLSYGLGRFLVLGWGRVYPFARTRRCVSQIADLLPVVLAVPAGVRAWYEPPVLASVAELLWDSSWSFKVAAFVDMMVRYGVWLLLVPRLFKPFYRGKIGGATTIIPTTAPMMSPAVQRTPTSSKVVAKASPAPGTVTVVAPSPVPGQGTPAPPPQLGAGVAAAARSSPFLAGEPASLIQSAPGPRRMDFGGAEDDAKGVPQREAKPDAATDSSEAGGTTVPGDGAAAGGTAVAQATPPLIMDDMVPSAQRIDTDWVDDDEPPAAPSPLRGVPVVEDHRLSRVELALQHSPTRAALCSATVVAGLLVEILELIVPDFPYAFAWMIVLIPWGLAVANDRHRGVYDSPFYVEMAMFAVMFVSSHGTRAFIVVLAREGAVGDATGSGAVWATLACYWVIGIVGLQYLWSVSVMRGMRSTDGWPLASVSMLVLDMAQRCALLQLSPFSAPYLALIVVQTVSALLRDSGVTSRPPSRLKNNDNAVREYLHDRHLRAQGSFFSAILASASVCFVIMFELVVAVGSPVVSANLRGRTGVHIVGQLVSMALAVPVYLVSVHLSQQRLHETLGRDTLPTPRATSQTSMRHLRSSRDLATLSVHGVLSASWDYWMWVITAAAAFVVVNALVVCAVARHFAITTAVLQSA